MSGRRRCCEARVGEVKGALRRRDFEFKLKWITAAKVKGKGGVYEGNDHSSERV